MKSQLDWSEVYAKGHEPGLTVMTTTLRKDRDYQDSIRIPRDIAEQYLVPMENGKTGTCFRMKSSPIELLLAVIRRYKGKG